MRVAVLCARRDSVYKSFGGCDVYDQDRDARTYGGGAPVIAHPPCRGWGRFAWRSNHSAAELELGRFCVRAVRENGGVLEHPSGSRLWDDCGLPKPGERPSRAGWTLSLDQKWFGHQSRKSTWLFVVGALPGELPALQYSLAMPERSVVLQSRADRERTPEEFACWLEQAALACPFADWNGQRALSC